MQAANGHPCSRKCFGRSIGFEVAGQIRDNCKSTDSIRHPSRMVDHALRARFVGFSEHCLHWSRSLAEKPWRCGTLSAPSTLHHETWQAVLTGMDAAASRCPRAQVSGHSSQLPSASCLGNPGATAGIMDLGSGMMAAGTGNIQPVIFSSFQGWN